MKKIRVLLIALFAVFVGFFVSSCESAFKPHEHTMEFHAEAAPTCTEKGHGDYYECVTCHRNYVDEAGTQLLKDKELFVEATGHSIELVEEKAATCLENGNKEYYECSGCHTYYADAEGAIEIPKSSVVIDYLGHDRVYHEAKDATCTEAGHIAYETCSRCDYTTFRELPALGHDEVAHEAKDATCTEKGHNAYVSCSRCDYTTYEEVAALGHDEVAHNAKDATCTEVGHEAYVTCSRCDYTTYKEVAALGHSLKENAAVAPTCAVVGSVKHYECSVCGKYFEDAEGKIELTKEQLVVPTVDHNLIEHAAVEPTLTTAGNVQYWTCSYCENVYLDAEGTILSSLEEVSVYAYQLSGFGKTPGYYFDPRVSHTFVDAEGNGVYVSNNKGIGSSGAYLDIFFTASGVVTFDYTVSSESGWDKFNIYAKANGEAYKNIVYNASGEQSGTITLNVAAGDYVYFQYNKDSGGNKGSDTVTISNIVFVTNEKFEKVEITYVANNGSEASKVEVYKGVSVELPAEPVKAGYFFDGWYVDAELTTPFVAVAGVNENTTLYAKYTKGAVVSFESTGDVTVENVIVRPGVAFDAPSVVPTTSGQYFKGWFADEACTVAFDFASGVTADTVVYAGWREPVVLTFDSNEGSQVESIATDINVEITLPANPTKENHRFDGWYTDEACTVAFVAASGISENTTVYAKWVEQVVVTYMNGSTVLGTETIDKGSEYSVNIPEGFTEIVKGWYVDAELENAFVDGSVVSESIAIYADVYRIAPEGVLVSFTNGGTGSKEYEWVYDLASDSFTSSNKGISSSKALLTFEFAKESFISFAWLVNSEYRYDYLTVKVNGTEVLNTKSIATSNGIDFTGLFTYTAKAGDVIIFTFTKDSSGNQGSDKAVISNLVINDGIPSASITFDYQDENVEDATVSADLNSVITEIENFASFAPVDTDVRHFGGWYYDAECTKAVAASDVVLGSVTLYAKYLYPATITFDCDGGTEIAPMQAWTGVAIEMPANPTKDGYIFRYWLNENAEEFIPANGISGDILLTAYFEELPVGSTKEEALVAELVDGVFSQANLTTTEEFQVFYVKFVAPKSDYFYFDFETFSITGGTTTWTSYRRYSIVDAEGNTVLSATSGEERVELVEGETYYIMYNLASGSNKAWGTFTCNIKQFEQDHSSEAADYVFGQVITTGPTTFQHGDHEVVYKYVAEATGTFALHLSSNAWSGVKVYTDAALSKEVLNKSSYAKNTVFDFTVVEGSTYYIVLHQNWSNSVLATNTMTFKVVEYPQGYAKENPFAYQLGEVITADFANGANNYYSFSVTEAGTYKLAILTLADTNSKTVNIYKASDLTKVVYTLAGSAAAESYLENVEAGDYVIELKNTSASYNTSFTAKFEKVAEGLHWSTAANVELTDGVQLNANAAGYYYTFTPSETLWYFVTPSAGKVTIYDASKKALGQSGIQLTAGTTYYVVVEAEEAITATVTTLVEYADGKTPSGAFTYNETNKVLDVTTGTSSISHTVYFKFTAEESGTYRFYTNNNGSVDTKGYLYSNPEFSSQIKYNDDGGNDKVNAGYTGYRYDFYFEYELVAGTTYYVKVTYSIYTSNTATSMYLAIEKA